MIIALLNNFFQTLKNKSIDFRENIKREKKRRKKKRENENKEKEEYEDKEKERDRCLAEQKKLITYDQSL